MIVDCHAHLEPRMLGLDGVVRKMDAAGVGHVVLIPAMNDPLPETPERLLALMRACMQRRLLRPLAHAAHRILRTPEGDLLLHGRTIQLYARPDNAAVAAAVRRHPARFSGWIFLNPRNNPAVLDELERWRAEPGMIGVKLHPHWHDYRTEILTPLLRRVEELGLPALIHLGFGSRGDYRALCTAFPRLRLIAAHAGFPFFQGLWAFALDHQNLYVDLSSPYVDEELVRACVRALGPRRCLYGTDAPYGFHDADGSYDYGRIKGWVERLPISTAEAEGVFAGNFCELADLSASRISPRP